MRKSLFICLGPLNEGAGMTQVMTGGVSYLNYDTPSVFAFGESTSLIEGGKGAVQNYQYPDPS